MSLDQGEVLQNLLSQRTELEKGMAQLQNQLEAARAQYLKVSGAIDVLEQLTASEEDAEEATTEVVTTEE